MAVDAAMYIYTCIYLRPQTYTLSMVTRGNISGAIFGLICLQVFSGHKDLPQTVIGE